MASFKYSNGMLFNPNDNDLVEKLSVYGEFSKNETDYGLDRLKLFRYIVMMYDMLSPMRLEYPDFWERKKVSALNAGFKVNKKGYFDEIIEKMLLGENDYVNQAVTKYVMLHGVPEYSALVAYQAGLYFETLKVQRGTITPNITKNIDMLSAKIRLLTEQIYGGSETINAKRALYSGIEKDRFPLPDDVVKRLNEGDKLEDYNPYGNYEVEPIKFMGDE